MTEDQTPMETSETTETSPSRMRIKFNLICASKVKKYALALAKEQMRTKNHTRVSEEFLLSCEVALKQHIFNRVKMQPTRGKTLT